MASKQKITGCIIKACSCKNAFQDKTYGKGKRVFNIKKDNAKPPVCTVCGKGVS